jgi:hypothetical protein
MLLNPTIGFTANIQSINDPILFVLDADNKQKQLRIILNGNPCDHVEKEFIGKIFDEALKMELVPLSVAQNEDYYGFEEVMPKYKVVRQKRPYVLEAVI